MNTKSNGSKKPQMPYIGLLIALALIVVLGGIFFAVRNSGDGADTTTTVSAGESTAPVGSETAGSTLPTVGTTAETTTQATTAETTTETTTAPTTTKALETTTVGYGREYAYAGLTPVLARMDTDWNLLLVNRDNILPKDYSFERAPAIPGSDVELDARAAPHYTAMYNAALADGIELTPYSGYRRISTQKRNFENKIDYYMDSLGCSKTKATQLAAEIVLPPGTSEHNAGLAMDICNTNDSFAKSDEFAWLSEHAADYGFILRYTQEKYGVTKIVYEPWHWRYVGIEHAKNIKSSGLCLEEYLDKFIY